MKKFTICFTAVAAALSICACDKGYVKTAEEGEEIVFSIENDIDLTVNTRASAVTSLSTVYWEASCEGVVKHSVASYSVSGGVISTGKYWPLNGRYDYKVSNVAFFTGTGAIAASNDIDVLVGTAGGVTDNSCTVTLNHIFARTASLTLNTQTGYELSDVSWKIRSKGVETGTAGIYTIGSGWSSAASTPLAEQEITGSSDLYLIPGTYTITVSYTLSKGDYSEAIVRSADVSLSEGCKNSITATAVGGNAKELTFSVSVEPWVEKDVTVTLN